MDKVAGLKQQVLEEFGEALKNPAELADAQETLAEVAEHVMDDMIIEDHDIGTLDIRAMQLATTQFKLCAEKAKEESYMIPIQTGDSVTGVSLKIVRGEKKKGAVDILFESSAMGGRLRLRRRRRVTKPGRAIWRTFGFAMKVANKIRLRRGRRRDRHSRRLLRVEKYRTTETAHFCRDRQKEQIRQCKE